MTQFATLAPESPRKRVSFEEFLCLTDGMHAEWVDGEVIFHMAVSGTNEDTHTYLLIAHFW